MLWDFLGDDVVLFIKWLVGDSFQVLSVCSCSNGWKFLFIIWLEIYQYFDLFFLGEVNFFSISKQVLSTIFRFK